MGVKIKDSRLREIIREELIMQSPIGPLIKEVERAFISQFAKGTADLAPVKRIAESLKSDILVAVRARAVEAKSTKGVD